MTTTIFSFFGAVLGSSIMAYILWRISIREQNIKFKLVALDKRLAVHQEAYTLWFELFHIVVSGGLDEEKIDAFNKTKEWWSKNCLYLDDKSELEFRNCFVNFVQYYKITEKEEKDKIIKQIKDTGKFIKKGIGLPYLGDEEKIIQKN